MLNKKTLEALYKTYPNRPESTMDLNVAPLFEQLTPEHRIEIDEDELVINSISPTSPFHAIPLRFIHQIVEFEEDVAIVLHSSILILNKAKKNVHVHMRTLKPSLWEKILYGKNR